MLKLDGSTLEGGGQLTRMALCLSAITGQAIKIHSIRAGRGPKSRSRQDQSLTSSTQTDRDRDKYRDRDRNRHRKSTPTSRQQQGSKAKSSNTSGGLKESHLAALQWLAAQTCADLDGAEVNSTEVTFQPGKLVGKFGPGVPQQALHINEDGTVVVVDTIRLTRPGSIWLIFQAIYPYMVFRSRVDERYDFKNDRSAVGAAEVVDKNDDAGEQVADRVLFDVTLIGGTNVPKSMSTEYVQQVFLPMCEMIGLPRVSIDTIRSGWTTGDLEVGQVRVRMYGPSSSSLTSSSTLSSRPGYGFRLPAFSFTQRGEITSIDITIVSTPHLFGPLTNLLTSNIASHSTYTALPEQPTINIHQTTDSGHERRLYILLVAHTSTGLKLGHDYLGNGGKPKNTKDQENMLEIAARRVVDGLMREIEGGGCVDEYMQDQIVTFQALADGTSQVQGSIRGSRNENKDRDQQRDDAVGVERHGEQEESDDRSGTLHTRTVRWVCEQIVHDVKFSPGGFCRTSVPVETD